MQIGAIMPVKPILAAVSIALASTAAASAQTQAAATGTYDVSDVALVKSLPGFTSSFATVNDIPSGQTTLADKIAGFEQCDDCFLTLGRQNRDLDPAFSNVEDGIRGVALSEDDLTLPVLGDRDTAIRLGEKCLRVEFGF
jgi:hypothetical protein